MQTPGMSFTEEESFVSGDRAVVRWRYAWGGPDPGHVQGVDVIRFRDGLVCEKLSYVKADRDVIDPHLRRVNYGPGDGAVRGPMQQ